MIRSETELTATLTRTALFGPDDMPGVRAVQHGFRITPLSEYAGLVPPPPAGHLEYSPWSGRSAPGCRSSSISRWRAFAKQILDDLIDWTAQNNGTIVAVICLVIGAKLIGDGISGL